MTVPPGRRERKKAATRQKIADAARRLFLEDGYDAVGIRDVAAEADVAVTTVFYHFTSKEALVFEHDESFEQRLAQAVVGRAPDEPLIPALRREVLALVRHCTAEGTASFRRMIDETPALRDYEATMRLRHAESLAAAIAADRGLPRDATGPRATARFVIDALSLALQAAEPESAVDDVFSMIEAAWEVTLRSPREQDPAPAGTAGD